MRRHLARRSIQITFCLVILALAGFTWAFLRESNLIRQQAITSWTKDVSADCAIVLTGGSNRVREGIDLLARKSVQKLIVSGVNPQTDVKSMFSLWPYYGAINFQDILLERRSQTTYGNAQQTVQLVEALRCRDVVLITSRAHMRRALKTFAAEFPKGFTLIPRTVTSGPYEQPWAEVSVEALKSLFYSLWAY